MVEADQPGWQEDSRVSSPLVLVGTEYALYREVFTGTLRAFRPAFAVRDVLAADLDAAVRCLRPWLVICSGVTRDIDEAAQAWIALPVDDAEAVVSIGGVRRTVAYPTLDKLLAIIDGLWAGVAPAGTAPPGQDLTSHRPG
jgi:hypothetical protein